MVGKGIPYFPLANNPLKKGERVIKTHTQPKISPIPDPRRPSLDDGGCNIPANNFDPNAINCNSTIAVPMINSGDSLKTNFPTLPSSTLLLDWPLGVTSNTASEIPKSLRTRLKIPKTHELVVAIISIFTLFHHARTDKPH